jgi:hypothetical protein
VLKLVFVDGTKPFALCIRLTKNLLILSLTWFKFQERKVKKIVMHEDYDSSEFTSDICLLQLASPLEFKTGEG